MRSTAKPSSILSTEPVRTCIGCRRKRPRSELVRIVAHDGQLIEGAGQPGRGAWLCRSDPATCFQAASKARRWGKALRQEIDPGSVASLELRLSQPVSGP